MDEIFYTIWSAVEVFFKVSKTTQMLPLTQMARRMEILGSQRDVPSCYERASGPPGPAVMILGNEGRPSGELEWKI